jgi:signal transduction histidine kinase
MSEGEDDRLRQRFKKIIGTIGERISRANTMATYLNRIAHRMDFPLSQCNVNDLLIEELALMERFAAMKNIAFDKNLQKEVPSIYNNPSLLQFIIFSLVNELIEKLATGAVIQLFSNAKGEGVEIRIESICPFVSASEAGDSRKD